MDASHQQDYPGARDRRLVIKRGAVTASFDPTEIKWNGERVPLSPIEAALLVALLRRSRLRWPEVNDVITRAGGTPSSREVLIHRIRRKFHDVGAEDPIETLRGWGLRFRAQADHEGSAALWIGATEQES